MPMAAACGAAVLAFVAGGCTSTSTTPGSTATAGAKIKGGTAVWAQPPSSAPNYIFPFVSSAYISAANGASFAQLMYRPLYWFGNGDQPVLNPSLSLANPPTWSGNTATITLKHYRWSNGSPVTTADVMFWINMLKDPKVGPIYYGAYNGFPNAVVSSIRVISATELQMTTKRAYSHT